MGEELEYKMAFSMIRGMSIDLAGKILDIIPSEKEFFLMGEKELRKMTGLRTKIADSDYRKSLMDKARKEAETISRSSIKASYYTDRDFPERLQNVCDAPIMLYSVGNCDWNRAQTVSIVGTRHATHYGQDFCGRLIADLSAMLPDVVVISGLAYGIDIAAHRACLKNNVATIAVVAHGLNTIYPPVHRADASAITANGAIVTEYSTQDSLHRGNFVARNRIVAGMADCTIVVESAEKGGALITASLANSYNRDVFALPGRIGDEYSKGCNRMISRNEAALITSAEDLVAAMGWTAVENHNKPGQLALFPDLTHEEALVYDILKKHGEAHVNVISQDAQMPVYKMLSILVNLEYKSVVRALPGSRYAIIG